MHDLVGNCSSGVDFKTENQKEHFRGSYFHKKLFNIYREEITTVSELVLLNFIIDEDIESILKSFFRRKRTRNLKGGKR